MTGKPPTSRPAGGRAPGRPVTDSPDLRAKLIQAALACFVRDGIAASSLRGIAKEAGVTPAMLHYYFGSKLALQDAVFEERLLPAIMSLREVVAGAGDDVHAMTRQFVQGVLGLVDRFPWLPALWVREVLCEGGALRELMLTRIGPALPQMLAGRFAQAQQRGEINAALDPRLLVVSMIGLTLFPAASAPIWRQIFQAELGTEVLVRHAIALLGHGMEPAHEN